MNIECFKGLLVTVPELAREILVAIMEDRRHAPKISGISSVMLRDMHREGEDLIRVYRWLSQKIRTQRLIHNKRSHRLFYDGRLIDAELAASAIIKRVDWNEQNLRSFLSADGREPVMLAQPLTQRLYKLQLQKGLSPMPRENPLAFSTAMLMSDINYEVLPRSIINISRQYLKSSYFKSEHDLIIKLILNSIA